MKWEFKSGVPIYLQIVRGIQLRIANGTYALGSRMPAVRELALEAGVNPNTMQRALAQLEQDGLLASVRTSGRFVTEDAQRLRTLRTDLSNTFIGQLYENLRQLGMEDADIRQAVLEWKEQV